MCVCGCVCECVISLDRFIVLILSPALFISSSAFIIFLLLVVLYSHNKDRSSDLPIVRMSHPFTEPSSPPERRSGPFTAKQRTRLSCAWGMIPTGVETARGEEEEEEEEEEDEEDEDGERVGGEFCGGVLVF